MIKSVYSASDSISTKPSNSANRIAGAAPGFFSRLLKRVSRMVPSDFVTRSNQAYRTARSLYGLVSTLISSPGLTESRVHPSLVSHDVEGPDNVLPATGTVAQQRVRSYMAVPVVFRGDLLAVCYVDRFDRPLEKLV